MADSVGLAWTIDGGHGPVDSSQHLALRRGDGQRADVQSGRVATCWHTTVAAAACWRIGTAAAAWSHG